MGSMNSEKLDELNRRAARASVLINLIDKLANLEPHDKAYRVSMAAGLDSQQALPNDILREAIEEGRKILLQRFESELHGLLAIVPEVAPPADESGESEKRNP
jgi:4-hydroxy-3-methylbut-2-enyl diphosphate reductase IspH